MGPKGPRIVVDTEPLMRESMYASQHGGDFFADDPFGPGSPGYELDPGPFGAQRSPTRHGGDLD